MNICLQSYNKNPLIHKRYFISFISICATETTHLHLSPTERNHLQYWHASPTDEANNHSTVTIPQQLHWLCMQILTHISQMSPSHKQTKASIWWQDVMHYNMPPPGSNMTANGCCNVLVGNDTSTCSSCYFWCQAGHTLSVTILCMQDGELLISILLLQSHIKWMCPSKRDPSGSEHFAEIFSLPIWSARYSYLLPLLHISTICILFSCATPVALNGTPLQCLRAQHQWGSPNIQQSIGPVPALLQQMTHVVLFPATWSHTCVIEIKFHSFSARSSASYEHTTTAPHTQAKHWTLTNDLLGCCTVWHFRRMYWWWRQCIALNSETSQPKYYVVEQPRKSSIFV